MGGIEWSLGGIVAYWVVIGRGDGRERSVDISWVIGNILWVLGLINVFRGNPENLYGKDNLGLAEDLLNENPSHHAAGNLCF